MVQNTTLANAAAVAMADAAVDRVDLGAGTAVLEIRSGTQPANPDVAAGGTLLASINLPNPAYGAAVDAAPGGRATLNGVPLSDASADATGTAAWFRIINRNGDAVIDGSVGTTDADLILNSVAIQAGANVSITSATFTVPES